MNYRFISLVIAFVVLGGVLTFQATRQGTSDVLLPSALAAEPEVARPRIRVAGRVSTDPIHYEVEPRFELRFTILDPGSKDQSGQRLPVVYNGIRPDMFAPGRDVIIDGNMENGVLTATNLLTQCPSKYEAPKPTGAEAPAV